MRYILRPVPELSGCFLLDALYWVAFHKYPETNFDLNIENLQELLDDGDICDPLRADYSFTFFNNDICARYGLPKNPASFDENPSNVKAVANPVMMTKPRARLSFKRFEFTVIATLSSLEQ